MTREIGVKVEGQDNSGYQGIKRLEVVALSSGGFAIRNCDTKNYLIPWGLETRAAAEQAIKRLEEVMIANYIKITAMEHRQTECIGDNIYLRK